MRTSQFFIPTLKEIPAEAQIISHRLMLRAGMIHQSAAGIYTWLPMGLMVLKNIANIIREEQVNGGGCEMMMPTIQSASLWQESGRYDAYGDEMLRMNDRHGRPMLYAPTAEEVVTDVGRTFLKSYRDFPKRLFQIHWKFRDEVRPRFGVMRGREFLMKDCYSFDLTEKDAHQSYETMLKAYIRTFQRLGVTAIPVRANTGPIGGDLSHEFHILANTGESEVFYDGRFYDHRDSQEDIDLDTLLNIYAAADELHVPESCPVPEEHLKSARGIEVGHIFYLGTKYAQSMGMKVAHKDGSMIIPHMGCYGIGVSRLVGAIIEASHDEDGIIWPPSIAPFSLAIVNLRVGDENCDQACEELYKKALDKGIRVLYDDRDERAGSKMANMDLIGSPWQIRIGPKTLSNGYGELKNRKSGQVIEVSLENILEQVLSLQ
jgi:prolyl-tRNA synthetase